jgi:hypothetical protein
LVDLIAPCANGFDAASALTSSMASSTLISPNLNAREVSTDKDAKSSADI